MSKISDLETAVVEPEAVKNSCKCPICQNDCESKTKLLQHAVTDHFFDELSDTYLKDKSQVTKRQKKLLLSLRDVILKCPLAMFM